MIAQLPTFALFKADRESSDGDAEAKNPLQQAVKEAQAALQDQISALEQQIEASVLDVAERTLDKLREMAPELANELTPRFKEKPKWSFNFTLDGENGIPINKRGSGVRRLILLNFFRAEAEKAVVGSQRNVIYAIEEPETSQHPNYQMMLMKALLELSNQPNRQIIVTTHVHRRATCQQAHQNSQSSSSFWICSGVDWLGLADWLRALTLMVTARKNR